MNVERYKKLPYNLSIIIIIIIIIIFIIVIIIIIQELQIDRQIYASINLSCS